MMFQNDLIKHFSHTSSEYKEQVKLIKRKGGYPVKLEYNEKNTSLIVAHQGLKTDRITRTHLGLSLFALKNAVV